MQRYAACVNFRPIHNTVFILDPSTTPRTYSLRPTAPYAKTCISLHLRTPKVTTTGPLGRSVASGPGPVAPFRASARSILAKAARAAALELPRAPSSSSNLEERRRRRGGLGRAVRARGGRSWSARTGVWLRGFGGVWILFWGCCARGTCLSSFGCRMIPLVKL